MSNYALRKEGQEIARKNRLMNIKPASELGLPFSTNLAATDLTEDTYETSSTEKH